MTDVIRSVIDHAVSGLSHYWSFDSALLISNYCHGKDELSEVW